jgi:uncharacterized Zn-finger protein
MDEATERTCERLVCVECGAVADEHADGWRVYLTVDDESAVYCPHCIEPEFGQRRRAAS